MCTDEQHREKIAAFKIVEQKLDLLIKGRTPQDQFYSVSNTQGFNLDYKDRKYIYLYSATAITLNLGALGSFPIPVNTWVNVSFQQGFEVITTNSTNIVSVFVRATDTYMG